MPDVDESDMVCLIGFTEKGFMHFVDVDDPTRGLCGVRLESVPLVQPAVPFVHGACQEALAAAIDGVCPAAVFTPLVGVCPECGGSVDVDQAGRVGAHRKAIVRRGVHVLAAEACAGVGQLAEEQA